MSPFAIELEQWGSAVRHVVGIHVSQLKSHLGLALISTFHLPGTTSLYSACRFVLVSLLTSLSLPRGAAGRWISALLAAFSMFFSPVSPWAPWWKPSVTAMGWPVCTDHRTPPPLTTWLWRGCLHEHPHTTPNHDLMPLIYTVSRAYQKVSSGALRQVCKGFAGTLLHRTQSTL